VDEPIELRELRSFQDSQATCLPLTPLRDFPQALTRQSFSLCSYRIHSACLGCA
jgi:hypothetical protein